MPGLQYSLEIAKNTVFNTQVQIQTISHNIANADNKAYARQKAVQVTNYPFATRGGWLGSGATIDRIVQQRDEFVERRLMDSVSKESDYKARSAQYGILGDYLADNGETGISKALGQFWDSWDALNLNPTGASEKMNVQQSAQQLAESIQQAYANLNNDAQEVESQISNGSTGDVEKANSLLTQIAQYNDQIVRMQAGGQQMPNDLLDKRYQALTDLAQLMPVKYTQENDGSLTISVHDFSTDITLVSGKQAGSLTYDPSSHRVTYSDYASPTGTISNPAAGDTSTNSLSGGEIGGLLHVYKSLVQADPSDPSTSPSYLDQLNSLASSLISTVNAAHNPGGTGVNVFSGSDASNIQVDGSFQPDGTVALNLSDLQQQTVPALGGVSLSQYLSGIQNRIGLDQQQSTTQSDFQSALRQQFEAEQQSASGVSIDEEMVDLLKQQQIYQAAAKLITHSAEMLNTIINMV